MIESFAWKDSFITRVYDINRLQNYLGSHIQITGIQAILVISSAILIALLSLVVQLGGFHVMLVYKGLTTYDFIVQEQVRNCFILVCLDYVAHAN